MEVSRGESEPDRLVMALCGCEATVVRGESKRLELTELSKFSQKLGGDN